jgi:ferric-dicitrate binding protein FerR (iron transport regulator)
MKSITTLGLGLMLFLFSTPVVMADDIDGIVETATVSRVLGNVKVFRKNRFERVYRGMKLRKGDEIRTGRRGRAYIDFPDNSRVKLGNRSRFLIRDWGKSEEGIFTSTLRIFQGAFRYTAGILSSGLTARRTSLTTHTAVLGVRGTDFWGRVGKDKTFFLLLEGEVSLAPRFGEEIVYNDAGKAVNINSSTISEPEALAMEKILPLAAETEIEER